MPANPVLSTGRFHRRASRAFTLLELIVVLVVLGIIALIAVPTFRQVILGSTARTALTTAEAIATNAAGIAKLAGEAPRNSHLRQGAQEVVNPDANLQLAFRGADGERNGVVGVKVTTGEDNNTSYACVFIADLSGEPDVRAEQAPAGSCPTLSFDGALAASSVLPNTFGSGIAYTNGLTAALSSTTTTVPAASMAAYLYSFDPPVDGTHPSFPSMSGGAFDNFALTVDGNPVASDDFTGTAGDELYPTSPWTVDITSGMIGASSASLVTDGTRAHSGSTWTPDFDCFCNGPSAATAVADSGTRVLQVDLAVAPQLGVMVVGFADIASGNVEMQAILMADGSVQLMEVNPGPNVLAASDPGELTTGDTVSLSWDGTTGVFSVNGSPLISATP